MICLIIYSTHSKMHDYNMAAPLFINTIKRLKKHLKKHHALWFWCNGEIHPPEKHVQ